MVVVITALVCGILFLLVPRYVLPACEYAGYSRMHCSDTAQAEQVIGAVLVVVSAITFFVKSTSMPLVGAIISTIVFGIAFWLPDKFGYCLSPRMPCNYGMVPAVRFLSIIGILTMIGVVFSIARSSLKKGSS
ncbi:MAG: DUF4418 family protein [Nitrospirae bacterium]|nr:DUF4418 family protein [Nitrospirota bacterium]